MLGRGGRRDRVGMVGRERGERERGQEGREGGGRRGERVPHLITASLWGASKVCTTGCIDSSAEWNSSRTCCRCCLKCFTLSS